MAEASGDPPEGAARPRGWTGILFVHGMGSQHRYGDVSALVEALDQRAREQAEEREQAKQAQDRGQTRSAKAKSSKARALPSDQFFSGIHPELEPARRPDAPPIAYIDTKWCPEGRPDGDWPQYRFYEAYWAPITAGGVPAREVVTWLFAQVAKPLGGLATPWRDKARLRRSILQGMSDVGPHQIAALFEAYDDYEEHDARYAYPTRRFHGFEDYLRAGGRRAGIPEADREGLRALARRWHRAAVAAELRSLFVLVTLAAALLAVTGLLVLTAAGVLALRVGATLHGRSPLDLARYLKDHKETFALLAGNALLLTGLASGLREYLGDVVFWTTYEETQTRYEKRRQILAEVRSYLSHLTHHPNCERIVVVAHSLGTAIAVDAILAEARDTRALHEAALQDAEFHEQLLNLRKITHVVTYGSPIDKIHYFFERDPGQHRYHRVVEDLRGDLGTEPFGNNGKPFVHWINFWDRADFVSGALESPANRLHPNLRVDNVEVASSGLLNPVQAHTGYLDRPVVLDALLRILLHRRTGHRVLERTIPVAASQAGKRAQLQIAVAILAVWALAGVLAYCVATGSIGLAASITAGLTGVTLLAALIGARRTLLGTLALGFESVTSPLRR